jgi:hypothetical protein
MHHDRFDAIVKTVSAASTRRGLLRLAILLLPPVGGLLALPGESGEARGGRHGRNRGHHPGKHKQNRKGKRKTRRKRKRFFDTLCLPPTADLQAAIYAAQPGATLLLCPGTFTVRSTILIDRSLELRGAGAGSTILDGLDPATQHRVQVLGIRPRIHVKLQGLTITNGGDVPEGGGIFNQGNLWVIECAVVNNGASYGGGIYNQGDLILTRGTIDQNFTVAPSCPCIGAPVTPAPCDGYYGGGIFNSYYSTISVRGTAITRNSSAYGAGIYNNGGTVTLEPASSVTGNTACAGVFGGGGGIYNYWLLAGKVILKANTIVTGNTPDNCYPAIDNCKG